MLWGRRQRWRERLSATVVEFRVEQQSVVLRSLPNRGTFPRRNAHLLAVSVLLLGKGKRVQELAVGKGQQQACAGRGGWEVVHHQAPVGNLQSQRGDGDVEGHRLQVRPGSHLLQGLLLLLPLLLGDKSQDLQMAVAVSAVLCLGDGVCTSLAVVLGHIFTLLEGGGLVLQNVPYTESVAI